MTEISTGSAAAVVSTGAFGSSVGSSKEVATQGTTHAIKKAKPHSFQFSFIFTILLQNRTAYSRARHPANASSNTAFYCISKHLFPRKLSGARGKS